jgi:hypothetical protein
LVYDHRTSEETLRCYESISKKNIGIKFSSLYVAWADILLTIKGKDAAAAVLQKVGLYHRDLHKFVANNITTILVLVSILK